MSQIYLSTEYNKYPGTKDNYDFTSGYQIPILPDVNLFRSFSHIVYANSANSQQSSTYAGTSNQSYTGYANTGVRNGVASQSTAVGIEGANIFKIPTDVNWVVDGGPNGNGICYNEKGDWFTAESLGTADSQGQGVRLSKIINTGTKNAVLITKAAAGSRTVSSSYAVAVPAWPDLKIEGAYNNAVFCYNKFEYTNDYEGTIYEAKSLFELPERIDNLVSFIPDQREQTTLTFKVRVDWVRHINWGIWAGADESLRNSWLGSYTIPESGTEYHTITHVVKNTNDYSKILQAILKERQRPLTQQDQRYGQSFPSATFTKTVSGPKYPKETIGTATISGISYTIPPST